MRRERALLQLSVLERLVVVSVMERQVAWIQTQLERVSTPLVWKKWYENQPCLEQTTVTADMFVCSFALLYFAACEHENEQ